MLLADQPGLAFAHSYGDSLAALCSTGHLHRPGGTNDLLAGLDPGLQFLGEDFRVVPETVHRPSSLRLQCAPLPV